MLLLPAPSFSSRILLSCEHGGNLIPAAWQAYFTGASEALTSHQGYDIGALPLAQRLAHDLNAPLYAATYSRLLIDLNRSPDHPRRFSRWTRPLARDLRLKIIETFDAPYRNAIQRQIKHNIAHFGSTLHVSIHSFTPELNSVVRQTTLGLLYDPSRPHEKQLCLALQQELSGELAHHHQAQFRVRRNYPYTGVQDGLIPWLRKRYTARVYTGIELEFNQAELNNPSHGLELCVHKLVQFLMRYDQSD